MVHRSTLADLSKMRLDPVAIALAALFAAGIRHTCSAPILIASASLYFVALSLLFRRLSSKKMELHEIPDSFLLSFAQLMGAFSREKAFLLASRATLQTNPAILGAERKIREGCPLPAALKSAASLSADERPLLLLLSEMLEYSAELTAERIPVIVRNRQERRKLRNEMSVRLQVVAFRLKVLTMISSAMLGVISFVSPLIDAFSGAGHASSGGLGGLFVFEPLVFFPLLSLTIASSYSASLLMRFLKGKRIVALSSAVFAVTHLVLIFAIK